MCRRCADTMDRLFPNAEPDERTAILWEATPFPMGSSDDIVQALERGHSRHGEDIGAIIDDAYREMDREFAMYRRTRRRTERMRNWKRAPKSAKRWRYD